MNKKFYNEKGYIVGVLTGEITSIDKEISGEDAIRVADLLNSKPLKKSYTANLVEMPFSGYDYVYEEIPVSQLDDDDIKEMFQQQILDSITVGPRPRLPEKEGYELVPKFDGISIYWDYEKKANFVEENGTFFNPIPYTVDMEVEKGKWYINGEDIWEAIASGIPTDFTDRNYFDII